MWGYGSSSQTGRIQDCSRRIDSDRDRDRDRGKFSVSISSLGEFYMSRVCEICGKGPRTGYNVSHSHRKTKRRWLPNLQEVRAVQGGTVRKIRVCTRCLRTGRVVKP